MPLALTHPPTDQPNPPPARHWLVGRSVSGWVTVTFSDTVTNYDVDFVTFTF